MGGWTGIGVKSGAGGLSPTSPVDPNAPLSTLLQGAGANQRSFAGNLLSPDRNVTGKARALGDLTALLGLQGTNIGTQLQSTPLNYWQDLLKPPTRQSILERSGPAVSSIVNQYDVGKRQVSQQARGGGTSATLANLPFQEAGAVTGTLEDELKNVTDVLQPEAAQAISSIGNLISELGLQELGLSAATFTSLVSGKNANVASIMSAVSQAGAAAGQAAAAIIGGS